MAKRWRPPFNFRRYCGDTATNLVHDLVCEKAECAVSTIPDENITGSKTHAQQKHDMIELAKGKVEDAKKASALLVDSLKDGDRLAVIGFDSKAEVLAPSSELDADSRHQIKLRIAEMRARGTTDMEGGLRLAVSEVIIQAAVLGFGIGVYSIRWGVRAPKHQQPAKVEERA